MRTGWLLLLVPALVLAAEDRDNTLPPISTASIPPRVQPSVEVPAGKRVVAIDVGHSEKHPGAISATGIPEYRFNKKMAEQVKAAFAANKNVLPVIITSSKELTLPERSRLAAAQGAEILVSIHHDSAQDQFLKTQEIAGKSLSYTDDFTGYSVFFSRKNPFKEESLEIARGIGEAMKKNGFKFARHHAAPVRGENRPIIDEEAGVYAFDDLVVLKTASMPAVLVECGVILNREDEVSLQTPQTQIRIAAAIVRGVSDYLARVPPSRIDRAPLPAEEVQPSPKKYPKPGTPLTQEGAGARKNP